MSTRRSQHKKNETNWIHSFQVIQPTRHKKDFTVYKVISKVFPKSHPEGVTTIIVWKRYNDFKKLFKELQLIHHQLHLFGTFPKFPKGLLFGRFENDIIEERRQAALTLLQFAALYPQLYTSKVFSQFFETGYSEDELVNPPTSNLPTPPSSLEDYLNKSPLVPQKVWSPPTPGDEDDGDQTSISSIEGSLLEAACASPRGDGDAPDSSVPAHSNTEKHEATNYDNSVPLEPVTGVNKRNMEVPTISVSQSADNISCPDSHYDIHTESGISSSASCSSLDTQVHASSAEELEQQTNVAPTDKLRAKKSYSFGLFDFLPIFPKKAKEKHLSDEKLLSESLTSSYICEAAGHFAVAQQFESSGEFPRAFSAYKSGIKVLLTGVQDDDNIKRKRLVRCKLEKYVARAEALNNKSYASGQDTAANEDSTTYSSLPVSSPIKIKSTNSSPHHLSSNLEDLKQYKVVKVIHKRVYIVVNVNVSNQSQPKCSVMKVLPKSSEPVDNTSSPLISKKLPFIISLQKWFESEHSYILLLEYASGGRLRDFVNTFQTKQILIPKFDLDTNDYQSNENDDKDPDSIAQKAASCVAALNELGSRKRSVSPKTIGDSDTEGSSCPRTNGKNGTDAADNTNTSCESEMTKQQMERERVEAALKIASLSLDNLKDFNTEDLIENSKFLLETVSQTLARAEADDVLVSEKIKEAEIRLQQGQTNRRDMLSPKKQRSAIYDNDEENNNNFKNGGQHEQAATRFESVQTASPIRFRESSSVIDLTEVGAIGSPDAETECINIKRMVPECCVKVWAAEIIMALETLHGLGLTYGDLDMKNILLGENGHILLSFKSNWFQLDPDYIPEKNDYSAPEVYNSYGQPLSKIHTSADYWSLGAILFELFTGHNARIYHPEGFHEQTILRIPDTNLLDEPISPNVKSLLAELLQYNSSLRLGYYGAAELKSHPLFEGFDWDGATEAAILEKSLYT